MINGADTQQKILRYNIEKESFDKVCTFERYQSDEQRTTIHDHQIVLSHVNIFFHWFHTEYQKIRCCRFTLFFFAIT